MIYSYRIEQALRAAALLHEGQVRKGKIPFPVITHLYAVMLIASDYTDNEDVLIAALLHDTLEDTDYTHEELEDDFGTEVADIVYAVSEHAGLPADTPSWSERKKNYIKKLTKAPEGALLVSAADKIHNMRSIIENYYDDHTGFLADFEGPLQKRIMVYQEISNILNRRLENGIVGEFNHVFDEYKKFIAHVEKGIESE